jgi:hypothetical protein
MNSRRRWGPARACPPHPPLPSPSVREREYLIPAPGGGQGEGATSAACRRPPQPPWGRVRAGDEPRAQAGPGAASKAREGGNHLEGWVTPPLWEAHRPRHVGHARGVVGRHLVGVGIVAGAPESRPVARVATVVDMDGRDADLVARHRLEVAHHVAHARVARDVHALPVGVGELGRDGSGQAEAQRGDVAPAEVAARMCARTPCSSGRGLLESAVMNDFLGRAPS